MANGGMANGGMAEWQHLILVPRVIVVGMNEPSTWCLCTKFVQHALTSVPCFRIWGHFPPFHFLGFGVIFRHSTILLFHHSAIPPFCYSTILLFFHSAIPPFCYSTILLFHHSAFPPFRFSTIQIFHHSAIPAFRVALDECRILRKIANFPKYL